MSRVFDFSLIVVETERRRYAREFRDGTLSTDIEETKGEKKSRGREVRFRKNWLAKQGRQRVVLKRTIACIPFQPSPPPSHPSGTIPAGSTRAHSSAKCRFSSRSYIAEWIHERIRTARAYGPIVSPFLLNSAQHGTIFVLFLIPRL